MIFVFVVFGENFVMELEIMFTYRFYEKVGYLAGVLARGPQN